jgi:hypothetical protein
VFNATFSNIMATSFSGGRSQIARREPLTMGKQLVNFITKKIHPFKKSGFYLHRIKQKIVRF